MPKTEWKRKKTKTKDSGASIRGPEHQRAWTKKRSKKVREGEESHKRKSNASGPEGDIEMADVQPVWELDDDDDEFEESELIGEEDDEPEDIQEQAKTKFEALARIVSQIPLCWP